MLLQKYRLLRNFLPTLALCALVCVSCGGGDDSSPGHTSSPKCDLTSQINAQKSYERESYYPSEFSISNDFSHRYGADISPGEEHYDIAKKVSRSVFEIEFFEKGMEYSVGTGTGWLIAPEYVVTAAHNFGEDLGIRARIHTFDGETLEAERIYLDTPEKTDLAVLRLKREIKNAIPFKIADTEPERNDFLMTMGAGSGVRGLGAWTVSAGPALKLKSGERDIAGEPGRIYHAIQASPGTSGGPILNEEGEVVSIVSRAKGGDFGLINRFAGEIKPFRPRAKPPEKLWIYAFHQPDPSAISLGPNPTELKSLYDKIPGLREPENAGEYRDGNKWKTTDHDFGDEYNPFPLNRFEDMNSTYKKAREGVVHVTTCHEGKMLNGSGFIYDNDTVITAGHVAPGKGDKVLIKTSADIETTADERIVCGDDSGVVYCDKCYLGTVSKTQNILEPRNNDNDQELQNLGNCDIAVIKMNKPGILSEYPKLKIGNSSSLQCGDPLVNIGSALIYNTVGYFQGVGAVHLSTQKYTAEMFSPASAGGMSGGPFVNREGEVISLASAGLGEIAGKWPEPGLLKIHTLLPYYTAQDHFEGPNAETMRRFIEEDGFYCE